MKQILKFGHRTLGSTLKPLPSFEQATHFLEKKTQIHTTEVEAFISEIMSLKDTIVTGIEKCIELATANVELVQNKFNGVENQAKGSIEEAKTMQV